MPYRKETPLAPFTMWRFLKERTGMRVSKETARIYAEIISEIGTEIAKEAVRVQRDPTIHASDIHNAVLYGKWKEKFIHGEEVCPKCGRPGYVIAKTPKKTSQKEYTYIYVKHGYGNAQQCIAGRLVSSRNPDPLASRDGNGYKL